MVIKFRRRPSEREIKKEQKEHPWATRKTAERIATDHLRERNRRRRKKEKRR